MTKIVDRVLVSERREEDVVKDWNVSVSDLILDKVRASLADGASGKTWISDLGRNEQLMYESIEYYVEKLACLLQSLGLERNGIVTIISNNSTRLHLTAIALWRCEASANLMNPDVSEERMEEQFRMVPAKLVVCIPEVLDKVKQVLKNLEQEATIILLEKSRTETNDHWVVKDFLEDKRTLNKFIPEAPRPKEDLAMILWSSGSTGNPKGIKLPLKTIIVMLLDGTKFFSAKDTILMGTWMFHIGGFLSALQQLTGGVSLFYLPPNLLTPQKALEALKDYNCDFGVFSYHDVIKLSNCTPDPGLNLQKLTGIVPVGAKLPIEAYQKLKNVFPNLSNCPDLYGATESGLVFESNDPASGGHLASFVEVKVINVETGEKCGPNENGEILIRTPFLTSGYVGIDNSLVFDNEGFFKSGDAGYYDSEGLIYFTDRIKDLIKVGLNHVYPAEVEAVLQKHAEVSAAGVFGIPDPDEGEACAALIITLPNSKLTKKELLNWINNENKIEKWKHLKKIKFVSKFPINPTGKKVRKDMRAVLESED